MEQEPTKVVGITLTKNLLLIHYIRPEDKNKIDENIAAIKWKSNSTLTRLVQAFAEVVANYIIGNNDNVEELSLIDMEQLFKDLLHEDDTLEQE